jgi:hypothetical protein
LPTALVLLTLAPAAGAAATTAFHINTLALRDPHIMFNFIGCRDVTDTPLVGYSFNGALQDSISMDSNGDGLLDRSQLILFDPLDQGASLGSLTLVSADCTAPFVGTHCAPGTGGAFSCTYQNQAVGACLAPLAGTTSGYSPPVAYPSNNCFATDPQTLNLTLAGIPMTLFDARVGGVYSGIPATGIVHGLIMGFLRESDANLTVLPSSLPLIGGSTLASLLPGGTGDCASHSDKDLDNGVPGWWMYLNFTADTVRYVDGSTAVDAPGGLAVRFGAAHPNPARGGVTLDYALPVAGLVRAHVSDLAGRRVAELTSGIVSPGGHSLRWDGRDASGAPVPAGIYFIRVEALGRSRAQRFALVR